jgi:hypothetical protein
MVVDPNRLLFVISARNRMKWSHYCDAVKFLSTTSSSRDKFFDGAATRSGLLQSFEALGHCDIYYESGNSTIIVAPPVLCRLPRAGLPVAVLAGARCVQTLRQITEIINTSNNTIQVKTIRYPGPLGLLPDTILISSDSDESMKRFCAELQIRYSAIPPAWTFVNWCGTLAEYVETLSYRIPESLDWTRFDFNLDSQGFGRNLSDSFPRYSRYLNPTTGLPIHVFFRDSFGAEVDLRWGRYLLLQSMGRTVTAYDERHFRLWIPVRIPLPTIVARTMCLSSGKPPIHRSMEALVKGFHCDDWLMFEGVPPQIALAALSKVGQSPIRIEIR